MPATTVDEGYAIVWLNQGVFSTLIYHNAEYTEHGQDEIRTYTKDALNPSDLVADTYEGAVKALAAAAAASREGTITHVAVPVPIVRAWWFTDGKFSYPPVGAEAQE